MQELEWLAMYRNGMTLKQIASVVGVSHQYVQMKLSKTRGYGICVLLRRTKVCRNCGKEFPGRNKYCSRICSIEAQKGQKRSPQGTLTREEVLSMRRRRASGETLQTLSKDFNRAIPVIRRICLQETYTHINGE